MAKPAVSVIIPAYRAEDSLPAAIASVRDSGLSEARIEVIIASDDGRDYAALLPALPFLTFTPPGPIRSGAGQARNRALAQARGDYIAFLDADDTWGPGYLARLLPLARRHGAAFGQTRVIENAQTLLTLGGRDGRLSLEDIGRTGASYHPVLQRRHARPFTNHLSQDVRHAAELLARLGGAAPVGRASYDLRLNEASITAGSNFAARVAAAYDAHVSEIMAGMGDTPAALRSRTAQVFRDKAMLNRAYTTLAPPGQSFYRFIAERLGTTPPDTAPHLQRHYHMVRAARTGQSAS